MIHRRRFLQITGGAIGATALASTRAAAQPPEVSADAIGCLVDTTLCIGCRKCEQACNERNQMPAPDRSFEDLSVFKDKRRPDWRSFTVVNDYPEDTAKYGDPNAKRTFVKFQCMHCNDPSCASACIVQALDKQPGGPVTYDVFRCIGCRYCMVACPFQIPAFEYDEPLTPRIRKCTFCFEFLQKGQLPACAQACPREVMIFGKRTDVIEAARWKIKSNPGKYIDHIYGEKEAGGTSWMYLADRPFEELGLPKLEAAAPPRLAEAVHHGVMQFLAAPAALFAALAGFRWITGRKQGNEKPKEEQPS